MVDEWDLNSYMAQSLINKAFMDNEWLMEVLMAIEWPIGFAKPFPMTLTVHQPTLHKWLAVHIFEVRVSAHFPLPKRTCRMGEIPELWTTRHMNRTAQPGRHQHQLASNGRSICVLLISVYSKIGGNIPSNLGGS